MNKPILFFLVAIAVLAACGPAAVSPSVSSPPAPTVATAAIPAVANSTTTSAPTAAPLSVTPTLAADAAPLYQDASQPIDKRVDDLLGRMTLAEKLGQMTQVENYSITPAQVTELAIGSVLSGGGGYKDNSPEAWRSLAESYEQAALKSRLGIPLLFGIDAVHGHARRGGRNLFSPKHRSWRDARRGLGGTHRTSYCGASYGYRNPVGFFTRRRRAARYSLGTHVRRI